MLTLSPSPLLLPKFGWKPEEDMIDELYYNYETSSSNNVKGAYTSIQSVSLSPQQLDIDIDSGGHINPTKKLSHNAYERDRRKKLNYLYCSLRSLLPDSDRNKKLSIPTTISRVLKYIPELQKTVEKLRRRKEAILFRVSRDGTTVLPTNNNEVYPVISVTRLDKSEVMVHICITSETTPVPLSEFLKVLKNEGLQLINASTFSTQTNKTFYTLHLQTTDAVSIMGQSFCEHLTHTLKEQGRIRPTQNFVYT